MMQSTLLLLFSSLHVTAVPVISMSAENSLAPRAPTVAQWRGPAPVRGPRGQIGFSLANPAGYGFVQRFEADLPSSRQPARQRPVPAEERNVFDSLPL